MILDLWRQGKRGYYRGVGIPLQATLSNPSQAEQLVQDLVW